MATGCTANNILNWPLVALLTISELATGCTVNKNLKYEPRMIFYLLFTTQLLLIAIFFILVFSNSYVMFKVNSLRVCCTRSSIAFSWLWWFVGTIGCYTVEPNKLYLLSLCDWFRATVSLYCGIPRDRIVQPFASETV